MGIKQTIGVAAGVLILSRLIFGSTPIAISPAALEEIITQHTGTTDFILVDVRENSEVSNGIIATEHCKPYHMPLNSGKFDSSYQLLPKTKRIIIYCRSGARSNQAATKLLSAGYDSVRSMTGGTNAYTGTLANASEFKPLSKLPEASYFGASTDISRTTPRYRSPNPAINPAIVHRQQFTLQGRVVQQNSGRQQKTPVYILERIGGQATHKINGLHRLVQDEN